MREFEAGVGITPGMSKAEKRAQRAKLQAQRSLDSRDAKMMSRGEWAEMSPDRRSSMCETRPRPTKPRGARLALSVHSCARLADDGRSPGLPWAWPCHCERRRA